MISNTAMFMNHYKDFVPNLSKSIRLAFGVCIVISMVSCMEKNTNDPIETYKYWAGELPPKEVDVIHGRYWQSSHWSKEYIMYMDVKTPQAWRSQFIKQNNLVETTDQYGLPSDAPDWFKPTKSFRAFVPAGPGQGSVYYEDTLTGRMLIYEIQL